MNANRSYAQLCRRYRVPFQFRLKWFFVLLTGLCVWLGLITSRVQRQRQSVEGIKRQGGIVLYDYEIRGANSDSACQSRVPQWLLKVFGVDFFHHVVEVDMANVQIFDTCSMSNTCMTDEFAVYLSGFIQLKRLVLNGTQATDRSLREVGKCTKLELVVLNNAIEVTDKGVSYLANLPRLRFLHISNALVTDRSLESLSRLLRLRSLNIYSDRAVTPISDQGLHLLHSLVNLEQLSLKQSHITPAAIDDLKSTLPKLKNLDYQYIPNTTEGHSSPGTGK